MEIYEIIIPSEIIVDILNFIWEARCQVGLKSIARVSKLFSYLTSIKEFYQCSECFYTATDFAGRICCEYSLMDSLSPFPSMDYEVECYGDTPNFLSARTPRIFNIYKIPRLLLWKKLMKAKNSSDEVHKKIFNYLKKSRSDIYPRLKSIHPKRWYY